MYSNVSINLTVELIRAVVQNSVAAFVAMGRDHHLPAIPPGPRPIRVVSTLRSQQVP